MSTPITPIRPTPLSPLQAPWSNASSDASELDGCASDSSSAPSSPVRPTIRPFSLDDSPSALAAAPPPPSDSAADRVARLIASMKAKVQNNAAPAPPPIPVRKTEYTGELDQRPGVLHLPASAFQDSDFDDIQRTRIRATHGFKPKSPGTVRRMLERAGTIGVPERKERPTTAFEPFSFDATDAEKASLRQLAEYQPSPVQFNPIQYHEERRYELERILKQGRNCYVEPKPLTIPESPALMTRERSEIQFERRMAQLEREEEEGLMTPPRSHIRGVDFELFGRRSPVAASAPFKPELTIPESPHFMVDERGEIRREQAELRAMAEMVREEQEREEQAARVARALQHRAPAAITKQELTIPESPALLTRERSEIRRELMANIRDRTPEPAVRAPTNDMFGRLYDDVPEALPFKAQLTIPESPMFATTTRGEVRREQREVMEIEAVERREQMREMEKQQREQREQRARMAARHYVAERRALTVPESPALLTRARGEMHAERFAALVQEEEERADAVFQQQPTRLAFGAAPVATSSSSRAFTQLTVPESPALLTKARGEAYRQNAEMWEGEAVYDPLEFQREQRRNVEAVMRRSVNTTVRPKQLTLPESPALFTKQRAAAHNTENDQAYNGMDAALFGSPQPTSRRPFQPSMTIPESPHLSTSVRGHRGY